MSGRHENHDSSTIAGDDTGHGGKGMTGLFPAAGHAASESIGTPRIALKVEAIRYSADHGEANPTTTSR
jgi:hypothetical protein